MKALSDSKSPFSSNSYGDSSSFVIAHPKSQILRCTISVFVRTCVGPIKNVPIMFDFVLQRGENPIFFFIELRSEYQNSF